MYKIDEVIALSMDQYEKLSMDQYDSGASVCVLAYQLMVVILNKKYKPHPNHNLTIGSIKQLFSELTQIINNSKHLA